MPGGLLVGAPWAAGHRLGGSTATARLPAAAPCPPHLHRLEVRRLLAADVAPAAGGAPGVARATSTPVLAPAGGSRGTTAAPAPHLPALRHRAGTAALSTESTRKPGQEPTLEPEQKQQPAAGSLELGVPGGTALAVGQARLAAALVLQGGLGLGGKLRRGVVGRLCLAHAVGRLGPKCAESGWSEGRAGAAKALVSLRIPGA